MTRERMEYIRGLMSAAEDLSDGAFLAVMEEQGVSVDELAEIAKDDGRQRTKSVRGRKKR